MDWSIKGDYKKYKESDQLQIEFGILEVLKGMTVVSIAWLNFLYY